MMTEGGWKRHTAFALAVLAVLPWAAGGCKREVPATAPAGAVQVYQVRGLVRQLPGTQPGGKLLIEHEPIDQFVDSFGDVVGMDSMVMPFTPAEGVSLAGLQIGDKVAMELRVDWKAVENRLTRIEKLPADTELHFGIAHRPATASRPSGGARQR